MENPPDLGGMIIDHTQVSEDALDGLIEEYATRHHGLNETESPLSEHKDFVAKALKDGRLILWFDGETQNAALSEAPDQGGF